MSRFGPYVLFQGNCAEAMTFYHTVFGGALSSATVGESPMKVQMPESLHARVVNARLRSESVDITASDWLHPTRQARPGNTVCLYISEGSYDELRMIFNKLWIGADPDTLDELRDLPFGSYGALTDKFGVRWMFQGAPRS
jgi:PhnB protein